MGKRTLIYGVARHSPGKFASRVNSKKTKAYQTWLCMITRCYSDRSLIDSPSYAECTVCDEWLEFQTFAEWFDINHIPGFAIDKDILNPGNKIYSPENCGFVPTAINTMLTHASRRKLKYTDLPPGVTYCTFTNKYMAFMCSEGKFKMLGRFMSVASARERYIECKKIEVIRMANKWRGQISERIYQALLVFPVDMEK